MSTLYRKYRPRNFSEILGQNHIKITLENEISSGALAHAYLFCGPRAVGKTTLARVLAKAVNCLNRPAGKFEPCDQCEACEEISAGRSLDIMEIDAASHTGVDNVRENIISATRVLPARRKYKVFIIDEVHMLSLSAFNALLKVIEEPPARVIFILCTTEASKVPLTIISRCQRFDFRRISFSETVSKLQKIARLEKIKVSRPILEAIARQADGHLRDAESILSQILALSGEAKEGEERTVGEEEAYLVLPRSNFGEVVNLVETLTRRDAGAGLGLINTLVDEGFDLKVFSRDLIEVLRKMLIAKINPALSERMRLEFGEQAEIRLSELAPGLAVEDLLLAIDNFSLARLELKDNFLPQLALEKAVIETNLAMEEKTKANFSSLASEKKGAEKIGLEPESRPRVNLNSASVKEIMEKWPEVLAKIKQHNHSLSFILQVCEPRDLAGQELCLAFKYKFHKDRINDSHIRTLVEKTLLEVYGSPLKVNALLDENLNFAETENGESGSLDSGEEKKESGEEKEAGENEEKKEEGGMINELLKTFGGKVL